MHTNIYIYIYIYTCICDSLTIVKFGSLLQFEKSDVLRGLLLITKTSFTAKIRLDT
jgi:hypothetical protein